ncbi:DUF4055 domain-containing protein [Xanthomonas citri pv. citri]|nr:putative structural protein [Achromobacter phage vB_Ade_ART]MBD4207872.1 DUF4055 domain-containing protein [Xanthomonas citri pv. citri]
MAQKRPPPTINRATPLGAAKAPPPPNFTAVHVLVQNLMFKWALLDDVLAGEAAVKAKGEHYLPIPRVDDDEEENRKRYHVYRQRAVFYNASRRTLDGLVGEVFSRDPIIELPPSMAMMAGNVDGAGVSIDQQSKLALSYVMGYGRAGLLADYPATDGPVTQADINSGKIRPVVIMFRPHDVINWRFKMVGAKRVPVLVVIAESYLDESDPFETKTNKQWRVLYVETVDGVDTYKVKVWRRRVRLPADPIVDGREDWNEIDYEYASYTPRDAEGRVLNEIPFTFLGSVNNNETPDDPPMYDLAIINIAHYRNSADYEESCFMVGQPTAWFSGLTQNWVEDVFKGKVYLGSRAAIPLPAGAQAGLLQVNPNSMPKEAMDQKERQMVALGAKLVTSGNVQRTLGEAQIEEASSASILSTATKNVSKGYTDILRLAAKFVRGVGDLEKIRFDLNTDFPASRLTPNDRNQLIQEWQSGAITWNEMRDGLRRGGIATTKDEDAKKEIEANPPPNVVKEREAMALERESMAANNRATRPNGSANGGNQNGQ